MSRAAPYLRTGRWTPWTSISFCHLKAAKAIPPIGSAKAVSNSGQLARARAKDSLSSARVILRNSNVSRITLTAMRSAVQPKRLLRLESSVFDGGDTWSNPCTLF